MRWTKTLINTLRDDPQEAEIVSHKLMIRAGFLRKVSGGLYTFAPLGMRVLKKVQKIIREEMDRAGAVEILMPALQPIELWEKSGRAGQMGASMFRLKDRADRTMVLGPTHEEVVTDYISREINSYRQLPCIVYQVQTKFRDEIRPRFGLMRAKEFIMKDAYSFDVSLDAADASYQAMFDAYTRIFRRCGLDAHPVEADTGTIGGNHSHEFMVLAASGEDGILFCPDCHYAANQERAERQTDGSPFRERPAGATPSEVATPGAHTVDEAAAAVGQPARQIVKSLVYLADGKPVMAIVEGNDELNECKFRRALGCSILEQADIAATEKAVGAPFGSIGPVGVKIPVYADIALKGARDVTVGANKDGFHVAHVSIEDDVAVAQWADIATVKAGDRCPRCGRPLSIERGIEVGHVFKLGTKYTEKLGARYLDAQGVPQTMVMGCYGIGVTRTVQAIVEQRNDADGIVWPVSVAPYAVDLVLLDPGSEDVAKAAFDLEAALEAQGIDVLVDDRAERPGVKFKDADLIGCPWRVVAGAKALAKGCMEVRRRGEKESRLVPVADVAASIASEVAAELGNPLFPHSVA
ncbi:MAG: proline--tRNA ligase [Kiritimatiellae bacterium]|nr:proline--tRNA ligase [Kiritimatiellia bacterium]